MVSIGGEVRNLLISSCEIEANHATKWPAHGQRAPRLNRRLHWRSGHQWLYPPTFPSGTGFRSYSYPGRRARPCPAPSGGRETTREGNVTSTGNNFIDVQLNIQLRHVRGVTSTGNTFWDGFSHDLLIEDSDLIVVSVNNFDRNPRYRFNGYIRSEHDGITFTRVEDSALSGNVVAGVWSKAAAGDFTDCRRLRIADNSILDFDRSDCACVASPIRLSPVTCFQRSPRGSTE